MESSCLYKISCKIVNLNQIKIIFKIYNSYKKILDQYSNEEIKNNPQKSKIIETRKIFEAQIKGLEKDILSYSESEDILNELNNTEVQKEISDFKTKHNISVIDERLNILFKLLSKYKSIVDEYTNEKIIDNSQKNKIVKTRRVFEAQITKLENDILEIVKKNQINTNNSNINNRITEFISNSRKENKQRNEEANKREKEERNAKAEENESQRIERNRLKALERTVLIKQQEEQQRLEKEKQEANAQAEETQRLAQENALIKQAQAQLERNEKKQNTKANLEAQLTKRLKELKNSLARPNIGSRERRKIQEEIDKISRK
jgi:hypothetical protein